MRINECAFCGRYDEYPDLPLGANEPNMTTETPIDWLNRLGNELTKKAYNAICLRRRAELNYNARIFYREAQNIIENRKERRTIK